MELTCGLKELKDMIYWNSVNICVPCGCMELCPAYLSGDKDYFRDGEFVGGKKCVVIAGYMNSVFDMMVRSFPNRITSDMAFRIGMHLVPLYKILCRLKMQEYTEREVMLHSLSGGVRVNPIFREIRDTVASIEKVWANLGFFLRDDGSRVKKIHNDSAEMLNGRSYYEVIESGGISMKDS